MILPVRVTCVSCRYTREVASVAHGKRDMTLHFRKMKALGKPCTHASYGVEWRRGGGWSPLQESEKVSD